MVDRLLRFWAGWPRWVPAMLVVERTQRVLSCAMPPYIMQEGARSIGTDRASSRRSAVIDSYLGA